MPELPEVEVVRRGLSTHVAGRTIAEVELPAGTYTITATADGHMAQTRDVQVQAVRRGDRFLLCSDGLSNLVDARDLGETVRQLGPQEAARHLVQLACRNGGDDNITVIVVSVPGVQPA